jgi:hypothetical protein
VRNLGMQPPRRLVSIYRIHDPRGITGERQRPPRGGECLLYVPDVLRNVIPMADDPDPPRKHYGFKTPQFERLNAAPAAPSLLATEPGVDEGPTPTDGGLIHVRDLARIAASEGPQLGSNEVRHRPNEVHDLLQLNLDRDRAAGIFTVQPTVNKARRARGITYWGVLILIDSVLGVIAVLTGPGAAIPFACSIGGAGMFTAWWTWENWFLRTD